LSAANGRDALCLTKVAQGGKSWNVRARHTALPCPKWKQEFPRNGVMQPPCMAGLIIAFYALFWRLQWAGGELGQYPSFWIKLALGAGDAYSCGENFDPLNKPRKDAGKTIVGHTSNGYWHRRRTGIGRIGRLF